VTRATSAHTTTALWWCRSRPRKAVYPVGLAVVPGDGLATVVAGDLGPYVVAMRSSTPSCSAVGDGPGQIDEPSMVELAPHGARALLARSKNSE